MASDLFEQYGIQSSQVSVSTIPKNKVLNIEDARISSTLPDFPQNDVEAKLYNFYHQHKDLPEQGSDEWLAGRFGYIGGSEIGSITGNSPTKIDKLIKMKAGLETFQQNHFMIWGVMFEDILRRVVERINNVQIIESSSIKGKYGQAYSPDGVGYSKKDNSIILYEFKCPYSRVLTDVIPKYYVDQVLLGLDTIDICDYGIYIEAIFRRCSLLQLGFTPEYDNTMHKAANHGIPIACGCAFVFSYNKPEYSPIDLGMCNPSILIGILYQIINKNMDYYINEAFINPSITNNSISLDVYDQQVKFDKFCLENNVYPVGILPYKLFQYKEHRIEKIENFAKDLEPKIREALRKIHELKNKVNSI